MSNFNRLRDYIDYLSLLNSSKMNKWEKKKKYTGVIEKDPFKNFKINSLKNLLKFMENEYIQQDDKKKKVIKKIMDHLNLMINKLQSISSIVPSQEEQEDIKMNCELLDKRKKITKYKLKEIRNRILKMNRKKIYSGSIQRKIYIKNERKLNERQRTLNKIKNLENKYKCKKKNENNYPSNNQSINTFKYPSVLPSIPPSKVEPSTENNCLLACKKCQKCEYKHTKFI